MKILNKIIKNKRLEIAAAKNRKPFTVLKQAALRLGKKRQGNFERALKSGAGISVIAEIKRRSPSGGLLRKIFDPVRIAREYQTAGAKALSVLTDEKFFGGSPEIFKKVKKVIRLPLLRKDFIVDEYQIWESRLIGADAVLLIAAILSSKALSHLSSAAKRAGLEVLFEIHTKRELKKVLPLKPRLIGINNRNLRTFRVDLDTTAKLAELIPKGIFIISESGIQNPEDLVYLTNLGVKAVLVGESLMKSEDPGEALRRLLI